MLCQKCPSKDDCLALCPQAERYVSQDSRYQRERPVSMGALQMLSQKNAWQEWLVSQGNKRVEYEPPAVDLSGLSLRQKQCLELHYFDGLSWGNIALRLGLSKSAVQQYIKAGLRKLQTCAILHIMKGRDDQCAETTGRACQ